MTTIRLTLAHSPDSDDMVMWWPLTGQRGPDGRAVEGPLGRPAIDPGRFVFAAVARDVEVLNKLASGGGAPAGGVTPVRGGEAYDITAISCATYARCAGVYRITDGGASFGEGYGPKVVVREGNSVRDAGELRGRRIAVPGRGTTAFLTLSLMLGSRADAAAFEAVEMLFSEIPGAVARGEVDAGLLIHEAQLSFAELGLRPVVDVGAWWAGSTGLPLPLGLNVVRRDLDERFGLGTCGEVSRLLSRSIAHAKANLADSKAFLRLNMGDRTEWANDALVERYLSMYVSGMTLSMGERGRVAIERLLSAGAASGLCPAVGRVDVV